jgi:hypothetical protein
MGVVGDRDHGRRYINLTQHTGDGHIGRRACEAGKGK